MKKNTTAKNNAKALTKTDKNWIRKMAAQQRLTIGIDLGDRTSRYCILNEAGEVVSENALPTTKGGLDGLFGKMPSSRVALEVGTHSLWVSRHLAAMGQEVIVANTHEVELITHSKRKNDKLDARKLARLARVDPQLLSPIRHRGEVAQAELGVIRARAEIVEVRTALINSVRGLVKPLGERLKKCDADQVKEALADELSETAQQIVRPMLKLIEAVSQQIAAYDQQINAIAKRYPEIELLTQVYGIGTLIALTYVLTIDDPHRFTHSRDVGCYLGLQPKQRESGDRKPELGISKAGDRLLRSYLVQAAHCMLRKGAPDSDLRVWALGKMENGAQPNHPSKGKRAKRRAITALARKLAVLLHRLWTTGEVYDPFYHRKAVEAAAQRKQKAAA